MSARTHSRSFASAATTPHSIFPATCRTETCAVLQVVLLAVHHLSVVLEVHAETSLWTSRIPMMSSVCRTGDCRPAPVMRCTSAGHTRKEREATNEKWTKREGNPLPNMKKVITHTTTHNTPQGNNRTKDSQIDSSFFGFSVVVHGRFFVDVVIFWLIPFAHET